MFTFKCISSWTNIYLNMTYAQKNHHFFLQRRVPRLPLEGSWKPHKYKNQLYHNTTDLLREQRFRLHPTFSSESYKPLKRLTVTISSLLFKILFHLILKLDTTRLYGGNLALYIKTSFAPTQFLILNPFLFRLTSSLLQ